MPPRSIASEVGIRETVPPKPRTPQARRRRNFSVIGERVAINLPNAQAAPQTPIRVTLTIDRSEAKNADKVVVRSRGGKLPACAVQSTVPSTGACVVRRTSTSDQDVQVTVITFNRKRAFTPARRRNF